MKALTTNTNAAIESFYSAIMRGIEAWKEAGKIVTDALENDPEWGDKVCQKHPEISIETVLAFDRIGRNQLHPRLLVSDAPGFVRLRALPMACQERYIKEPVKLLVKTESGWETLQADVANLTSSQARQVFDGSGVRSEAAQRTWLEDQAAKRAAPSANAGEPFRVVGRSLVIMEPCKLSAGDIARILAQMEN